MTTDDFTTTAWSALGGDPQRAAAVEYREVPGALPSTLPVRQLARATVAACSLAAAELLAERNGTEAAGVRIDEGAVATAFTSERQLRIAGRPLTTFAPHSGFWRTADGRVRTHANYPHHRTRLLAALGLPEDASAGQLEAELRTREAVEVQETAYRAGALAVAVAEPHPIDQPLIEHLADPGESPRRLAPAELPAAGVRVLDLTRVIAGPVATRTLALLGADVLRIDSPFLPESEDAHADTGFGKRSTLLDLADPDDIQQLRELAATADVVVTAYRPGALDRFGLTPADLPGAITVQLNAWGWHGPWAGRRGFDSLVQAGTGIARLTGEGGEPGVLPAQALDHGTGYLIAAGVLRALTRRQRTGRTDRLRYSLAGTAHWLLSTSAVPTSQTEHFDPTPYLLDTPSPYGPLRHACPPLGHQGAPATWQHGPTRWGTDQPAWRPLGEI